MDDAFSMGCFQSVGDLNPQPECFFDFERTVAKAVFQGLTLEILHHKDGAAFMLADVVYRADMRMVQSRRSKRLPLKAFERTGIPGELVSDKLEGNEAVQAAVFGLVHHPHAAAAQPLKNSVMRNCLADHGEGLKW